MNYVYTFIKGNQYIRLNGDGNPYKAKNLKWFSSLGAKVVLEDMLKIEVGYSGKYGFIAFDDFKFNMYAQIARFASIYKDGWRFKETNLPDDKPKRRIVEKAKTKRRIYVRAATGRKAYYRMQEVGREEIEPVEHLWEVPISKFRHLIKGSKTELQSKYIEEFGYNKYDEHPELKRMYEMMEYNMKNRSIPILADFEDESRYCSIHETACWRALDAGETVPLSAIKNYPDLMLQYRAMLNNDPGAMEGWNITEDDMEVNNFWEMPVDEYERTMKQVRKDYTTNPFDISDAMLVDKYPGELDDVKRAARMRKKIFNNIPSMYQHGYSPDTIDEHLYKKVLLRQIGDGVDISDEVKGDFPTLFTDMPFKYEPTGNEKVNKAVNEILTHIRDESPNGIVKKSTIDDIIISFGHPVPIKIEGNDEQTILINDAMAEVSDLCGEDLLNQLNKYDGEPVKISQDLESDRASGGKEIKLAHFDVDVDNNKYNLETIAHEYGHSIEYMLPEVADLSRAFLNRRTEEEYEVSLKNVVPYAGYDESEITKVDNFMNAYIGRQYKGDKPATEVLSMGMGYLTKEILMQRMYKRDPEYLGFVLAILSGKYHE